MGLRRGWMRSRYILLVRMGGGGCIMGLCRSGGWGVEEIYEVVSGFSIAW